MVEGEAVDWDPETVVRRIEVAFAPRVVLSVTTGGSTPGTVWVLDAVLVVLALLALLEEEVELSVLLQKSEPTCTVFVERELGWVLVKGRPPAPVKLPFLCGVQVIESRGTPSAPVRYRLLTVSNAESVYRWFNGTVMVVFASPWPAPPWLASMTTVADCAAAVAAQARVRIDGVFMMLHDCMMISSCSGKAREVKQVRGMECAVK